MTANNSNKETQKQKLKKYLVFAVMILAFAVCMWLIFAPSGEDKDAAAQGEGFNSEIPDPRGAGIVGDKKTAYEQEQLRLKQEEKMRSLQDYSYMLEQNGETEEERIAREERQIRMAPKPVEYYDNPELFEQNMPSRVAARNTNSFQSSGNAYRDINATLGSFYEEPAEDTEKDELQEEVERLRAMVEQQNAAQMTMDDQMALLERSYELASQYMGNTPGQTTSQPEQVAVGKKTKVVPVGQVRTDVVTTLRAPMSDLEFVQMFSEPRNTGFHTVGDEWDAVDKNTISAVVHGDQVLVDGQSIRLRMTEPMRAGRFTIPRNTILTGLCKIGGERLEIAVNSIEYEGNIIPVEMSAYDSDGQPGIYIPGSMEIAAFKEIAGNMGQNLGTTINLNQQSAGEQLLTDVGRGVIQGTSQYISKKARQVKVTLKSGYRLFLLPGENI